MLSPEHKKKLQTNTPPSLQKTRGHALDILDHVLTAIDPSVLMGKAITRNGSILQVNQHKFKVSDFQHIYLIGFGKASGGMAQGILEVLSIDKGAIITNSTKHIPGISTYRGSHPIPTGQNITATKKLLEIVDSCGPQDLLIVLISGGGSSMFCLPLIPLPDMKKLVTHLLKKGSTIDELNTVRGHLSHVKLGGLAAKCKGTILSLILSDVIGDPLDFIASGPTYPGKTSPTDAKNILKKYGLWTRYHSVKECLEKKIVASQKKIQLHQDRVTNIIIANNHLACTEAIQYAKNLGYYPVLLSTTLSGEASKTGETLVKYAKVFPRHKTVIVAGGETTVTVKGKGKGGRNQELVLSAVKDLAGTNIVLVSCGTDGIDGPTDAAGAIADGHTLIKAEEQGIDPRHFLADNDSYTFFNRLNDLVITGATGTNIMDIQIIVIP